MLIPMVSLSLSSNKLGNSFNCDTNTAKNTVISPDFLVWRFCGKAQFPHSFGRYAETVPFCKISKQGNQVKLRYI